MIDDTRGRVPFAVLGVLLLVSSLTLAPTLSPEPVPSDTAVERSLTEVTAETRTAMHSGVSTAGRRAATEPVVQPANTSVGRALNDSQPFRDALRLRVYLQVRDRLEQVSATSEGVEATASLPAVETTEQYRRAIDRVRIERAGENDTAMRATVENVTITVRRGDRVVTRRSISPTVVVAMPTLLVHDQVQRYESRLNNGLGRPGLSQRLTARLYPIAWARGYAQYGGAPIENVVANRHVSLATNGAVLGVQRSTFGRSDPEGRQALTEATAAVGVEDVVAGSNGTAHAGQVLDQGEYRPVSQGIDTSDAAGDRPSAGESMRVGVNETADRAFREVASPAALESTLAAAYSVDAKLVTESERLSGGKPTEPERPGAGWQRIGAEQTATARVVGTGDGAPSTPDGGHELETFARTVEVTHTRTARWKKGNFTTRTRTTRTERRRVGIALIGRHANASVAPPRPILTAHDPAASPLDGPNLAGVPDRAERKLLDRNGGKDGVAERVAAGKLDRRSATITGERPTGIRPWIYRDLQRLRGEVRTENVTVERGEVGSFEAEPASRLRARLDDRRVRLVDAPDRYDSAAHRARVAARIDYLDAVDARLAARAEQRRRSKSAVSEQLSERTGGSLRDLRRGLTARDTPVPRSKPVPIGPAGPVRTRVDARPQYLTLAELDESRYPPVEGSEHPLVARNVNVFTVPYGDAAGAITDELFGSADRVRLSTAAETLSAAEATPGDNETLDERRATLRTRVDAVNDDVGTKFAVTVREETAASDAASREIVEAALREWDTTAGRGKAIANGSAADRVAAVAAQRRNLSAVERDWLRLQLREAGNDALEGPIARPRQPAVNQTAAVVRTIARDRTKSVIKDTGKRQIESVAKSRLGSKALPSGLPLAPPVTPWYATANVWWVTVEGEYARFSVTADYGTPSTPGAQLRYTREAASVTLDADDDGRAERLGENRRLSFRAETGVVVVVPPKPRGVGDKDGVAVETSAGWPTAGAE